MWILIIYIWASGGPTMTSAEFESQLTCENAKVEVYRAVKSNAVLVTGICVKK